MSDFHIEMIGGNCSTMAKLSPRQKYNHQKADAKHRGIGFDLTFEEWWDIWQASGRWYERGNVPGKYVMARNGDVGPYAVGNVRIALVEDNRAEQKWTEEALAKMRAAASKRKHTAETRAKISAANQGRIEEIKATLSAAWTGRKHNEESRAKIGASLRGRKFSEESRAKMRASQLGKKHTEETRAKMKASQIKRRRGHG